MGANQALEGLNHVHIIQFYCREETILDGPNRARM